MVFYGFLGFFYGFSMGFLGCLLVGSGSKIAGYLKKQRFGKRKKRPNLWSLGFFFDPKPVGVSSFFLLLFFSCLFYESFDVFCCW